MEGLWSRKSFLKSFCRIVISVHPIWGCCRFRGIKAQVMNLILCETENKTDITKPKIWNLPDPKPQRAFDQFYMVVCKIVPLFQKLTSKTTLNRLGSEVFSGPLKCSDMLWHLCLFLLLVTFSWLKSDYTVFSTNSATVICQQHVCKSLLFWDNDVYVWFVGKKMSLK